MRKNKNHDQKEIPCCVLLLATCYLKGLLGLDIGTNMDFHFDIRIIIDFVINFGLLHLVVVLGLLIVALLHQDVLGILLGLLLLLCYYVIRGTPTLSGLMIYW